MRVGGPKDETNGKTSVISPIPIVPSRLHFFNSVRIIICKMSVQINSEGLPKLFIGIGIVVACILGPWILERGSQFRLSRRLAARYPIANEKWDAEAKKQFAVSADSIIKKGVALVGKSSICHCGLHFQSTNAIHN
jgi:hypothetical protein